MIGIITEKPSAMRNFAKALGGNQGVFNNEQYVLCSARGHLFTLLDPSDQVPTALQPKYKSWDIRALPWKYEDIAFSMKVSKGCQDTLNTIKHTLARCDEIIIATDDDPTGEGQLIAWDILIHLQLDNRKISRMYFTDETPKSLQKAFVNRKTLPHYTRDGEYLKATYRRRWDFLSMQFTRVATKISGSQIVVRQGRLKSAMVRIVGDGLDAISKYKKVPSYMLKYKDEKGVIYTSEKQQAYPQKEQVSMSGFTQSPILQVETKTKQVAPPKLLDLAGIASTLAPMGFDSKEVYSTYQKMYEAGYLSYTRTEDKFISHEQFNEMLPLVNSIASVIGVDTSLLTHRTARSSHVKDGGSHGANRPGTTVPSSLSILERFGKSGIALYQLVAVNFLAMFAENYVYESHKGVVRDYPDFIGYAKQPVSMGWKVIYNDNYNSDEDEDGSTSGLGAMGSPYVHTGYPPRPPAVTMKWLMKQLENRDVGTGATRTSTYGEVCGGKTALLKDTKGKISLRDVGLISYKMLPNTHIGDLTTTEHMYTNMSRIEKFELNVDSALSHMATLVVNDIETMTKNAQVLQSAVDKGEIKMTTNQTMNKETVSGVFIPTGVNVTFKRIWGGYRFSDTDVNQLLAGYTIQVEMKGQHGPYTIRGKLAEQMYEGRTFFGFKKEDNVVANDDTTHYTGTYLPTGKQVKIKRTWGSHTFTEKELEQLCEGSTIEILGLTGKTGKTYGVRGKLDTYTFNNRELFGFVKIDFI